jgi:hypothetical protein
MVLHEQKHESHERSQHVVRNGWKGVNILDENYPAKDPHILKVLLFFNVINLTISYIIFADVILRFCQ